MIVGIWFREKAKLIFVKVWHFVSKRSLRKNPLNFREQSTDPYFQINDFYDYFSWNTIEPVFNELWTQNVKWYKVCNFLKQNFLLFLRFLFSVKLNAFYVFRRILATRETSESFRMFIKTPQRDSFQNSNSHCSISSPTRAPSFSIAAVEIMPKRNCDRGEKKEKRKENLCTSSAEKRASPGERKF